MFLLTKNNVPLLWSRDGARGLVVAPTRELADEAAVWFRLHAGADCGVVRIATGECDALQTHQEIAQARGATCTFFVEAIEGNELLADAIPVESS